MADYREKIKIDIETDIDTDKISGAKESFQALSGSLDSLDGTLSGLDVDDLNQGLNDLQDIGFDGLDALENRSNSINQTIGHTTDSVRELNEVLGEKIDFEARLDTDKFVADLSDDLGEGIDEKDLEVPVAPKGKLETPDVQELEQDISEFMGDVQEMVDENEDLHIKPRVADEAAFSRGEKGNLSQNISRQLGNTNPKITPQLNMEEIADEDLNKLQELSDALKIVETKKEEVSDENERLETRNNNTSESTDREAKSFVNLIEEADNLTSVKRAAGRANEYLSDTNKETAITALEEKSSIKEASEEMEAAKEIIRDLEGHQKNLGSITDSTADETDSESKSLRELANDADNAAEMKENVSKYNKRLGGITKETAEELGIEGDKLQVLTNAGLITSGALDEASDSGRSLSRTLSAANESVDETGDSLRAAAEIGDIFEDGLGSLSVNLGAFTIALRNFLTQVPLLITALGAAAEAAAGAASAFIAVAGAITAAVAAGAIARARELKEEYSQIEELGQSVQVIFSNVRDTFLEAAEPAFSSESIELFQRAVEGTATVINLFAQAVSEVMTSSEDDVYSLQKAFDDLGTKVLPEVDNLVEALIFSFETLGEETIGAIASLTGLLADLIQKSTRFVARISDLGDFLAQFKETITALSELGLAIGSGLIPVFTVFSNVMQTLADTLNQLDDEVLGNIVTFTALVVAFSRISGVVSTLVTIIPNLAVGFASLGTEVKKADTTFKAFQATVVGTNSRVAHFLSQISVFSGVSALIASLGGMSERFRQIAFRSSAATARFEALALGTNVTAQQLYELAVAGDLTKDMMQGLQEEAEDVDEDFRKLQLRLALTEEQFEDIDGDVDIDVDEFGESLDDPDRLLDTGGLFSGLVGDASSASKDAKEAVVKEFTELRFLPEDERGYFPKMESVGDAAENINVLKLAQFDLARATDSVREKLNLTNLSSKSLGGAMKSLALSVKIAAISFGEYTVQLAEAVAASVATLYQTRSLSEATDTLRDSKIADRLATLAQSSALAKYIKAVYAATFANYSLAASFTVLTGGMFALVALVGALAVGIISNFDKIKGSVDGAVSGIMPILGALKDILLTIFVEVWNIIVAAVSSLITAFKPLGAIVGDVIGILTTLFGMSDGSTESFLNFGSAIEFTVAAIKSISDVIQIMIGLLGVAINVVMQVVRAFSFLVTVPLQLFAGAINLIIDGLIYLIDIIARGVGSSDKGIVAYIKDAIDFINVLREQIDLVPERIESGLNSIISQLNSFIEKINDIFMTDFSTIGRVNITGGDLQTTRDELSRDTERVGDDLARVAPNVINMKEENNQTVNQSIDADPEDKSTVSRVVEDAIERANRFERTRAGQ